VKIAIPVDLSEQKKKTNYDSENSQSNPIMIKCSTCVDNKCRWKYENRRKCVGKDENIECICSCQQSVGEEIASSAVSIGCGMAAAAGGIALTMLTSGVIAVVGGAAMIGAGSSLVMNPLQKKIAGERMTLEDSLRDVALGATIGKLK
jgi:hypothetical protein